ncbi:N-acetyltransferase family protein [Piscinibacter sakaiensis]|uniref:GNAT family N-acetyltransferase n=1 Tax=Piscinibacter sakaiensis TaxID=1547922 RepID=UPI003AADD401
MVGVGRAAADAQNPRSARYIPFGAEQNCRTVAPLTLRSHGLMPFQIAALSEAHFVQLHAVADAVAREARYLAMTEAPPFQEAAAFYRSVLATGQCHVALDAGAVVGWCDVLPVFGESRRHVGVLGIGLAKECRGRGLGGALLRAAIDAAWARGLTRIELTVREDNGNARRLYEKAGFLHEGIHRRSFLVNGRYVDACAMALLKSDGV